MVTFFLMKMHCFQGLLLQVICNITQPDLWTPGSTKVNKTINLIFYELFKFIIVNNILHILTPNYLHWPTNQFSQLQINRENQMDKNFFNSCLESIFCYLKQSVPHQTSLSYKNISKKILEKIA